MRVLLVNDKGCYFGGVEQFIDDTATGLLARGHSVHFLHTEPLPEDRRPLAADFESRTWINLSASAESTAQQLNRMLEAVSPDAVYLHRVSNGDALSALRDVTNTVRYVHDHDLYCPRRHKYFPLSKRICPHPLGVHCVLHGCLVSPAGPLPGLPGLINLPEKAAELSRARALPRLAAGSRWMTAMMKRNGFSESQVRILPPVPRGIERDPISPSPEPVVLYVGQVIRGKGIDLMLRALSEVKRRFRCVVIGTGNFMAECVSVARNLGLGERVTFLGWVDHAQLGSYYARARLVVVPSRWPEPFGMVGLEAMWSSRPVVAFGVGGIPDWLVDGETGFTVPEQDTHAFAQAIDQLLGNDAQAERMGIAGYERARTHYRHEAFLDRTEALLHG